MAEGALRFTTSKIRGGGFEVYDIENTLKIRFSGSHKVDKYSHRLFSGVYGNIVVENFFRESIPELKLIVGFDPYLSGLHILMGQFTHLNISEGTDNRVVNRCQIHSTERPDKTSFHRRTVNVGIMHGCRILDQKLFQGFRIVGITVNQCFDQKGVFDTNDLVRMTSSS